MVVMLALAALGCGADNAGGSRGNAPANSPADSIGAATGDTGAGSTCLQNATQPCICIGGGRADCPTCDIPGRQNCLSSGTWGECDCISTSSSATDSDGSAGSGSNDTDALSSRLNAPPENFSDARFDWLRTEATGGSCEAGHYEGSFEGWYGSPLTFTVPIPVSSIPAAPGMESGFQFDLEQEGTGEIFNVAGGKLKGLANGLFPFEADIEGKLDCTTKKFEAELVNGWYDAFGLRFFFHGPLLADYNKVTHTFVNGTWNVEEEPDANAPPPDPNLPPPLVGGGDGTWTTTWVP